MKSRPLLIFSVVILIIGAIAFVAARNMITPDETIPIDSSKPSKFKFSSTKAASAGGGPAPKSQSPLDKGK